MPQSSSKTGKYAVYKSPYYGFGNLFLPSTKAYN